MTRERVTLEDLEARLADPDVPDAEIAGFLRPLPGASLPFEPRVVPDPSRVALRPVDRARMELLDVLGWANAWSRRRRLQRFERRFEGGDGAPVLVSEGDSWFQFPFFLRDVIDQLEPHYLVYCLAAAGDTIANMTGSGREYVTPLVHRKIGPRVRGLLFSAGGNDILGSEPGPDGERPVLETLLRRRRPGLAPTEHLREDELAVRLDRIEAGFRQVLETVRDVRPGAFVVGHVYAYALPAFDGDPREPSWTRHGRWLRQPLERRGFTDRAEQRAIVRALVDRLHERLARLMGGNCPGGTYPHGYLVDCRSLLDEHDWADEIHPTDAPGRGFGKVADAFHRVIQAALASPPAGATAARARGTRSRSRRRTR